MAADYFGRSLSPLKRSSNRSNVSLVVCRRHGLIHFLRARSGNPNHACRAGVLWLPPLVATGSALPGIGTERLGEPQCEGTSVLATWTEGCNRRQEEVW